MKLDIIKTGEIKRDIKIEVGKESLKDIRDKVLDKLNKRIDVPGFRKGKAPLDLVEKRHPDLVREELLKEAIPFYYNLALKQKNLEVVSLPKIKDTKYQEGELFFVAEVELRPQIEIDDKVYKNIKLKYPKILIDDKEVEKFIEEFKENISQALDKKKEDIDNKLVSNWLGYINEDELRQSIYSELYLNKAIQRRRDAEKEITDNLLAKFKFEIPSSLIAEQKKELITRQILELRSRNIPEEEIKKHYDEILKKTEAIAKDQIKLYYILEEIAKKEKLKYEKNNLYEVVFGFILSQMKTQLLER